ncbi:MAG: 30S ribosomal protein S17 [Leptospirales bacterium]|jgi:small subunit ribosomal protein S17
MAQKERSKNIKFIQGRVVSDKLEKTRIILVESTFAHPLFKKMVRRSVRIKIHDERNEAKVGDLVQAIETRPLSAQKRHRLHKVMERSQ